MTATVFCQIVTNDISPEVCNEIQQSCDPNDCFGCGAHSRLCCHCRVQRLHFPELGLCQDCLEKALAHEQLSHDLNDHTLGEIHCQIAGEIISASTCVSMQGGEGCNLCPSPFRLCEQCGARTVHYSQYGLCLHCAYDKYASPSHHSSIDMNAVQQTIAVPHSPPPPTSRPTRKHRKARIYVPVEPLKNMNMTARDLQVIEGISLHGFLSTDQIHRLFFFQASGPFVRRRLRLLYDHKLIKRVRILATPAAARGLPPFVYTLACGGRSMMMERLGLPVWTGSNLKSLSVVRHRFLVNEFFVTITEAVRKTAYKVIRWLQGEQLKITRSDGTRDWEEIEHPLLGNLRGTSACKLRPHGYFEVEMSAGDTRAFFVDVDLATHAQRIWRQRSLAYAAYAEGSSYQQRFGQESFQLLILTTPEYRGRSRLLNIAESIRNVVPPSALGLFLLTTLDKFCAEKILREAVWYSVADKDQTRLLV